MNTKAEGNDSFSKTKIRVAGVHVRTYLGPICKPGVVSNISVSVTILSNVWIRTCVYYEMQTTDLLCSTVSWALSEECDVSAPDFISWTVSHFTWVSKCPSLHLSVPWPVLDLLGGPKGNDDLSCLGRRCSRRAVVRHGRTIPDGKKSDKTNKRGTARPLRYETLRSVGVSALLLEYKTLLIVKKIEDRT